MKKNSVTISILVLVILLLSMVTMVFISRAAEEDIKNPYDSANLTVDDIIATYHANMNDAFNRYLKLMMTNIDKNPDDPNGKAFKEDGTPFTVADCLDPANANNYSTFCVAVNLLGGNSANCYAPPELYTPPEDFKKFCSLGGNAQALKGIGILRLPFGKRPIKSLKPTRMKRSGRRISATGLWLRSLLARFRGIAVM
ncbi:MAG: hypothetical protein U0519_00455 [Candidatus Gracilibacteria bacterium]